MTGDPTVARFYDGLADHYHLLFADWDETLARQGDCLDRLIARSVGPGRRSILDATCGIGTQALGLARHGHTVTGSDLSAGAIERARREAARLGLAATFRVADILRLDRAHEDRFEVVCALDNALPHLPGDVDLAAALRQMAARAVPGGMLMISIRDYDRLKLERPRSTGLQVFDGPEERRIVFQVWDWAPEGDRYDLQIFMIRQRAGRTETLVFPGAYRALTRAALTQAMTAAGLAEIRWLMPEESDFYQPLAIGRVAAGGCSPP